METTNFIIDAQAPAKHNIKAEQKLAKTRKGEKYDAVMLKKNLIKGVKKKSNYWYVARCRKRHYRRT